METYFGYVKTPQDAILLFEACRVGFISRIQRRLSDKERSSIRSGSVFVWDEREAGMRRWTDGKSWSASRVSGSFLTYRELESKRKSSSRSSNNPHDLSSEDTDSSESYHSSTAKKVLSAEQCRYKHGGLVKQSFSITTTKNQKLHLICYYTKADVIQDKLQIPTQDDTLKNIVIPKGLYPETTTIMDGNLGNNNNGGLMINPGNANNNNNNGNSNSNGGGGNNNSHHYNHHHGHHHGHHHNHNHHHQNHHNHVQHYSGNVTPTTPTTPHNHHLLLQQQLHNSNISENNENRSPSPYAWQYQQLSSPSASITPLTTASNHHQNHHHHHHHNSHFHREPMQIDSHSPCSTRSTPSISSSPSTTEDDFPNYNNNNNNNNINGNNGIGGGGIGRFNFFHHPGGSTASLPSLYHPHSSDIHNNNNNNSNNNGYGNGSQPINIPRSNFSIHSHHHNDQSPFPASYPPHSSNILNNSNNNGNSNNNICNNDLHEDLFDQQKQQNQLPPQDIPWEKIRNTEDQRQLNAIYTTLKL